MVRSSLLAVAIAGALVSPASGQLKDEVIVQESPFVIHELTMPGDGVRPLATWCTSPLQTACISFFNWRFRYFVDGPPYLWVHGQYTSEAALLGSFNPGGILVVAPILTTNGWYFDVTDPWGARPDELSPGGYRLSGSGLAPAPALRATTLFDPIVLMIENETCVTADASNHAGGFSASQRCVRVPEPSSLLLLATGGLGLAYVQRRRLARRGRL